jgi:dihydroneopterin aldolase
MPLKARRTVIIQLMPWIIGESAKKIIQLVEVGEFNLLEKLANDVVNLLLAMDRVEKVSLEVDKPHALRFARSVSFSMSKSKPGEEIHE